ncbi:uncharacterized protein N7483_006649 [Penicillium malachiteum]|uniref:uncharacterized protein n=1 Tax=Penicillium malachiteum TaxID=1324776 RepID=UPI0025472CFE|nr:uncharacterized protein N7483_006649 [Penicillium malachiteum]KAJ5725292.1 hypothetical protein N7483_006649 [Penicillium malachiteum]
MGNTSFQVIVLGPTGGPREDAVTGILVRSTSTNWTRGSVIAVDAGTMLAGIVRLMEPHIPTTKSGRAGAVLKSGPFKGLKLPNKSAQANAAHVFRDIIGGFFITHPHLDHVSGLAMNTPIIEAGNGPKPVSALPSVLAAIKNHVFNDIIWPNLSDEDGGAGLLTYQRLVEGGNPRLGVGETRGYIRACDGLTAKCLSVSHGQSWCSTPMIPDSAAVGDPWTILTMELSTPPGSPRLIGNQPIMSSVESSAFFLRDDATGDEIVVFGDVEPDSISLEPRNRRVWETAAPKIATGKLPAIFIECSYTDSVHDPYLYGHLCPRHLVAELTVLADKVLNVQERMEGTEKKRKRPIMGEPAFADPSPRNKRPQSIPGKGRSSVASRGPFNEPLDNMGEFIDFDEFEPPDSSRWAKSSKPPLLGLSVYIIHIKETLNDGLYPGTRIIKELQTRSDTANLGCQFFLPDPQDPLFI